MCIRDRLLTEAELDGAFDAAEQADWDIIADAGLIGIASGLDVTQHSPTADLTVDVTSGTAYDPSGKRVRIGSGQTVDLSVDHLSASTAVGASGNSKVISLYVYADRLLSDPRVDGNSNTVQYSRAESFAFYVKQGSEATTGTESPPALEPDKVLLADVTIDFGQTQIVDADINTNASGGNRRQDAFVASAGNLAIREGTAEEALAAILTELNNHITDVANAHATAAIDGAAYSGSNLSVTATDLESQIQELCDAETYDITTLTVTGTASIDTTLNLPGTALANASQINTGDVPLQIGAGMSLNGPISPSTLAATENNYNPTGWATAGLVRLTPDGGGTGSAITGFAAPSSHALKVIVNLATAGTDVITLANQNASSSATNRIITPGGTDYIIDPGGCAILIYDTTSGRWRVMAEA